jgi:hypothetical protein
MRSVERKKKVGGGKGGKERRKGRELGGKRTVIYRAREKAVIRAREKEERREGRDAATHPI